MKNLIIQELPLDRKVLIEASAGTGKTFTIGLLVLRLLLKDEDPLTINKIILITFTEAATSELRKKTRLKIMEAYNIWKNSLYKENDDLSGIIKKAKTGKNPKVKEANLLEAIARIDEMPVFTIHGFCKKLLSEFTFETGNFEENEVITDTSGIINNVTADFWRENIKNLDLRITSLKFNELTNSLNAILNNPYSKITGENYKEALDEFRSEPEIPDKRIKYSIVHKFAKDALLKFADEKKKLKAIDFNDMIENCHKAIKKDNRNILQNAVKKRYGALLVDEFQDTDKLQYEIFDYLFKDMPFSMIGDPKQAIYSFRGGDIFTYKEARKSAGEFQYSMNTNYRSEKTMLDALNSFFEADSFDGKMGEGIEYKKIQCGNIELKPIKTEKDGQYHPFVIWKNINPERSEIFAEKTSSAVVEEIKRLLNTGKIFPKDIAIILNTNDECRNYKNILAWEKIPAVIKGGSVFYSEAAYFLRILLNAICHNNKIKNIRALLTSNFCGYEPKNIDDNLFLTWTNAVYEAKIKWERYGIMNCIEYFMTKQNLWQNITNIPNGERHITNIRQIMELLDEEEIYYGKIPEKIYDRYTALCGEGSTDEKSEEKLETDDDSLKILTFHKSKGLEFNIVFIPNINRNPHSHKFPNPYMYHNENGKIISYHEKNDSEKILNDSEENEENARILYVAMTRAKERLYVSYNPCKLNKNGSLSHGSGAWSIGREIFYYFLESQTQANIQVIDLDKASQEKYTYKNTEKSESFTTKINRLPDNFKIKQSWQRSSFSSIASHIEHPYYDYNFSETEISIPAGKRMGTLLHSIFENLDFTAGDEEINSITETMFDGYKEFSNETELGRNRKLWIANQIRVIIEKKLPGSAGKLCKIDTPKKTAEINFYMKSNEMNFKRIREIMGNKINDFKDDGIYAEYLKGAIDLVFLGEDDKYYILDWKSNSLNNYTQSEIEKAMQRASYHLQYYIYAAALKRWLEKTHENFDFKKQFGGVYYIFIRGVKKDENNYDGIYFAQGDELTSDIEKLDVSFTEAENEQ